MCETKDFCTDIYAVKQMGLKAWRTSRPWPVTDEEFFSLGRFAMDRFDLAVSSLSSESKDLLLADYKFLHFALQILHAAVVEDRITRTGGRLIIGHQSRPFYRPDYRALGGSFGSISHERSARWRMRGLAKALRFSDGRPFAKRVLTFWKSGDVWDLGSFTDLKRDYCRKKGLACSHHYFQTLLKSAHGKEVDLRTDIMEACRMIMESLSDYSEQQFGVVFRFEGIISAWIQRIRDLNRIYCRIQGGNHPKVLLLSEMGNPVHRPVVLGLRRLGAKIVGFHHGNDMVNAWERHSAYVEDALCDEFVCPSVKCAEFSAREYALSGISRHMPVSFVSVESHRYKKIRESTARYPFPEVVETVMVMGFPMTAVRNTECSANYFAFQLDLELKLVESLKAGGFKVIYKAHPEVLDEIAGVFENMCKIMTMPFENCWEEAQAFVFGCTTSTTFGFSLCLNRPVAVIDMVDRNWNPEAYSLLEKRCLMVPASFDDNNRIHFDEEYLCHGLKEGLHKPDFSYVEQLMFPQHGNQ